jgi:hypothetical protein
MLKALAKKTLSQEHASDTTFVQRVEGIVDLFRNRGFARAPVLRSAIAVAAVVVLIGFGSLAILSSPTRVVDKAASPAYVSGIVELLPAGSHTWRPFAVGGQARTGDRVRTGPGSTAVLVFFDGSTTRLEAETDITLVQMSAQRDGGMREIVLQQWMGETGNIVQPASDQAARFDVETPAAIIAVRGTAFSVFVETDGSTDVTVSEGLVDVTAQGTTVRVSAGRGVTVVPEQPPSDTRLVTNDTPTPEPSSTAENSDLDTPLNRHSSDESPDPTATLPPSETREPDVTPTPTLIPPAVDSVPADTPEVQPTHRPHPVFGTNPSDQPGPPVKPTKTPRP